MKLPLDRCKQVVRDSVLVALDLLIVNHKAEVLVGRRQNPPAKDWLFVPESLDFRLLTLEVLPLRGNDTTGTAPGKGDSHPKSL